MQSTDYSSLIVQETDSNILPEQTNNRRTLGAFFGVIVPCCLSMFSIVLFLRVGYLVGYAGISGGLLIICLSYTIIIMTVLSLCALCTNGKVESGGAYYMISRTLGPEFGAAIGLMFFIANVASCALYILGFIETLLADFSTETGRRAHIFPEGYWSNFLYASVILLLCSSICTVGANAYAKSVVFVFIVVLTCLSLIGLSFFITEPFEISHLPGNTSLSANYTGWSNDNWQENLHRRSQGIDYISKKPVTFLEVFAIFFNGCIGVMAGVNVSGELIEPNKSIPRGTFLAVGLTGVVYVMMVIALGGSCSTTLLQNDYSILQTINISPIVIFVGVAMASFSAVLSNMIGASRVLYAIGNDNIFGRDTRPTKIITWCIQNGNNPVGAVFVTWLLVQCFLLLGNLNAVAPVVTIFFLLAYAAVDCACLLLTITSAPNFRPTFTIFSAWTCSIGAIGTVVMMILVSPEYSAFAFLVFSLLMIGIHLVSSSTGENSAAWGHISQALIFHQVRKYLLRLDSRKDHVKYWRPQILCLIRNPLTCTNTIRFANYLKKSGLLVIGHIVDIPLEPSKPDRIYTEYLPQWLKMVDYLRVKAFVEVARADSITSGAEQLLRLSGLGGMKPNTLMMGFFSPAKLNRADKVRPSIFNPMYGNLNAPTIPETANSIKDSETYVDMIRAALSLEKNICIVRNMGMLDCKSKAHGYIDVWPVELLLNSYEKNSGSKLETLALSDEVLDDCSLFLLQMACVLSMSHQWKKAKIHPRIMIPIPTAQWPRASEITAISQKYLNEQLRIKHAKVFPVEMGSWLSGNPNDGMDTRATCWNELIKCHQNNTIVSFLYLPKPNMSSKVHHDTSTSSSSGSDEKLLLSSSNCLSLPDENYLTVLDLLSQDLGPVVFIHGLCNVISTVF